MLRNGASKGPNFAGHYTIATWGCGVACQEIAVMDAEAGQVFFPENLKLVAYHMVTDQSSPIEFRLDSRLLIIRGAPNDGDETGISYYEWDGRRLTLLKSVPKVWPKQAQQQRGLGRATTAAEPITLDPDVFRNQPIITLDNNIGPR